MSKTNIINKDENTDFLERKLFRIQQIFNDIKKEIETLKQNLETKKKESVNLKKTGSKCLESGKEYEKKVFEMVKDCTINNKPFNTQNEEELGGSSCRNDIECDFQGKKIGIECKAKLKTEYIQVDIHLDENNEWAGPTKRTKKSHPQSVVERYLKEVNKKSNLFYGNPPPFKNFKTKEEFDIWERDFLKKKKENGDGEKKDYRWYIDTPDFVAKNYKEKGNSYIQIKGQGLYYLESDVCNFGVPKFNPKKIELRIRCKRRGKQGCIPSSLTVSAWVSELDESRYSLDDKDKLPQSLKLNCN
tara:strand:+ start:941 stop:1846 length:906 start_codon:yes stop_codon:yes gene_type:complete